MTPADELAAATRQLNARLRAELDTRALLARLPALAYARERYLGRIELQFPRPGDAGEHTASLGHIQGRGTDLLSALEELAWALEHCDPATGKVRP